MYQKSVMKFLGFILVTFLSLMAGCSRQVPSGELGSSAVTYYVKPGGNNALAGTSLATAWASINYAVNYSGLSAGDTIKVQPGTYNETVTITKSGTQASPITLLGDGTYGTIIIQYTGATKNNYNEGAIVLRPSDLTNPNTYITDWFIRGFRINGGSDPQKGNRPYIWAGILVNRGQRITINQNYIYRSGASGISVRPGNVVSTNPAINCNSDALMVTNCARQNFNIDIFGNTLIDTNLGKADGTGDQEALSLDGVDGFRVFNNTVQNGLREGITAKGPTRNGQIYNNFATNIGRAAIYVGGQSADSFNIDIYRNTLYNNKQNGISVSVENPAYLNTGGSLVLCPLVGMAPACSNPASSQPGTPVDTRDIRIYNNLVYGNGNATTQGKGITITSQIRNVYVYNNTFAKNYASFLINENYAGYYSYNLFFRNNIFSDNSAGDAIGRGLIGSVSSNVLFENNLFTGTGTYYLATGNNQYSEPYSNSGATPSGNFCTSSTPGVCSTPAFNKVTVVPIYTSLINNNYTLPTGSPALNAGRALTVDAVTLPTALSNALKTDFAGTTRPQPTGSRPDVGAYESPN
jgi:hypothetical protein